MKRRRGDRRPTWRGRLLAGTGAALAGLIGLTAATVRPGAARLYPPPVGGGRPVTVYVTYNHFHSDLNVPTAELVRGGGPIAEAVAQLKPEPWTVLGWGDAKFYQGRGWSPARIADLVRSMLWPWNPSVVHLAGTRDPLDDDSHPQTLRLQISPEGLQRLKARLDASFALRNGRPIAIAPGHAPDALFFEGRERASAIHVCNHWTAQLLNAAGAPITPVLDLPSDGMALDLKLRAQAVPIQSTAAVDKARGGA